MLKRMLVAAAVVATLVVVQGITSAASLKFSGEGSKIEFVGTKPANRGKHDGGFKTFTGTIDLPGTDFTQAKVSVEIVTDSIYSDNGKLTQHLKTPDFFDVRTYPKANFTSTAIKAGGSGGATHEVTGNLTLHGVTKPITVPVKVKADADGVTLEGTFTLKRLDFGINYRPDQVNNDVTVKLTVKTTK